MAKGWALLGLTLPILALGARERAFNTLIFGGQNADIREYPYQIGLLSSELLAMGKAQNDAQFCGGSLVSANWVLTAAHCCQAEDGTQIATTLLAGATVLSNTSNETSTNQAYYSVDTTIVHPDYTSNVAPYNDVCMLEVKRGVALGDFVAVIPMAASSEGNLSPGTDVVVTGWGDMYPRKKMEMESSSSASSTDSSSEMEWPEETMHLQELEEKVATPTQPLAVLHAPAFGGFTFIGSADTRTGACPGDSGGPTVSTIGGQKKLVGVNSFIIGGSPGEAAMCGSGFTGLATVGHYRSWIDGVMATPQVLPAALCTAALKEECKGAGQDSSLGVCVDGKCLRKKCNAVIVSRQGANTASVPWGSMPNLRVTSTDCDVTSFPLWSWEASSIGRSLVTKYGNITIPTKMALHLKDKPPAETKVTILVQTITPTELIEATFELTILAPPYVSDPTATLFAVTPSPIPFGGEATAKFDTTTLDPKSSPVAGYQLMAVVGADRNLEQLSAPSTNPEIKFTAPLTPKQRESIKSNPTANVPSDTFVLKFVLWNANKVRSYYNQTVTIASSTAPVSAATAIDTAIKGGQLRGAAELSQQLSNSASDKTVREGIITAIRNRASDASLTAPEQESLADSIFAVIEGASERNQLAGMRERVKDIISNLKGVGAQISRPAIHNLLRSFMIAQPAAAAATGRKMGTQALNAAIDTINAGLLDIGLLLRNQAVAQGTNVVQTLCRDLNNALLHNTCLSEFIAAVELDAAALVAFDRFGVRLTGLNQAPPAGGTLDLIIISHRTNPFDLDVVNQAASVSHIGSAVWPVILNSGSSAPLTISSQTGPTVTLVDNFGATFPTTAACTVRDSAGSTGAVLGASLTASPLTCNLATFSNKIYSADDRTVAANPSPSPAPIPPTTTTTTSSTPVSPPTSDDDDSSVSGSGIAGISVGGAACLYCLIGCCVFLLWRSRNKRMDYEAAPPVPTVVPPTTSGGSPIAMTVPQKPFVPLAQPEPIIVQEPVMMAPIQPDMVGIQMPQQGAVPLGTFGAPPQYYY